MLNDSNVSDANKMKYGLFITVYRAWTLFKQDKSGNAVWMFAATWRQSQCKLSNKVKYYHRFIKTI